MVAASARADRRLGGPWHADRVIERLDEPVPRIAEDALAALLRDEYGIDGPLRRLAGERDLNHAVADDYVLKVQNATDGEDVIEMSSLAIAELVRREPELPVSRIVPTRTGALWHPVTDAAGRTCFVRLFTLLRGHHPGPDELDERGLYGWARVVARVARGLRGFFHPAARYEIAWDIGRTLAQRADIGTVPEAGRDVVAAVLDRFESHVAPVLGGLRAQVVHNDMGRANVLVDDSGAVSGIIDFGDMTHTALVCDLAVAMADVLNGRADAMHAAPAMIAGYRSVTPLEPDEAAVLADLIAARLAITAVIMSKHVRDDDVEVLDERDGAIEMLHAIEAAGFARFAEKIAAEARGAAPVWSARTEAALRRSRDRTFGPQTLSYDEPLHVVRGEGAYLIGADGRRYLDAYNNVPVVGHCHPAVVRAIAAQIATLNTNTRYLNEGGVELAERLIASAPSGLDRVLFVNSGSEANDLALRIARFATGRRGALVTRFAYHGITAATFALSPESWQHASAPPDVALLDPPGGAPAELPHPGHPDVAAAVAALGGDGLAVTVVDGSFISDGMRGPAHGWIRRTADATRTDGGLYVADEVQAGFGRTGDALWSVAAAEVAPDFITLGKPMGNGFPVAAVLTRSDLADPFIEATDYFSTFGGNTVAAAAGLAVLGVIETDGLIEQARTRGERLFAHLDELARRTPALGEVRCWGLMAGVDVLDDAGRPDPARARRIANELRQRGVLIGQTGPFGDVLKIRPPLIVTTEQLDLLVAELGAVLPV
jgi:4-aminobutyrate aminotransferase-like enzyme/Ser/Thr protein kinase RdoA (MazF antagonist)